MAISNNLTLAIVLVSGLTIAQLCWATIPLVDSLQKQLNNPHNNPNRPFSDLLNRVFHKPFLNHPIHNNPVNILIDDPLQYLIPHNVARAKMSLPPLVWNISLAEFAKSYAQQRSVDCKLQHSESPGIGENIAMGTRDVSPAKAVELWAEEQPSYDYGSNTCKEMCGHYTQVVWRDTKSIGCARSKCRNGGTFVTCNYYPPGNVIGQKPY